MAAIKGHFSVQVQDYNPTTKAVTQPFSTSTGLLADMAANFAAYLPLLDAVIAGKIIKAQIVIPIALPGGLKASAVANVDNFKAALVGWLNATTTDRYGLAYPGWYTANTGNGWLPASPSLVNQADAAVAAFLAFNEANTNNTSLQNEDGYTYSGVGSAIKSSRSIRKQLARAK